MIDNFVICVDINIITQRKLAVKELKEIILHTTNLTLKMATVESSGISINIIAHYLFSVILVYILN